MAAMMAVSAMAKSPKRGVSENQFGLVTQLEALEPGVTWYYNWGSSPGAGMDGVNDYEGLEFVPMCWNGNYNADAIRAYCKAHPSTKYLLGFNEPNFTSQANMTPQEAAAAWPGVQALAKELGLKLVAPALNYSPNPPYTDPLKWMDEFVAIVGLDAFDYVAVHNYGGLGVMKTIAGNFHNKYGKDVWVTEFCLWPNEGSSNDYVTPENQIKSMVESLEWLESTEWIFRYAWFKALGNYDKTSGPNFGLVKQNGAYRDPWALTPQGNVYVHMPVPDPDLWHPVGEDIAACYYLNSNIVSLGETADSACPVPIEINSFNTGASATWQFDIKNSGEHYITLSAGGYGEPTRFDPQLQWMIVEDGKERAVSEVIKPSLPNNDTDYQKLSCKVTLPAGHIQLRLKDMAPYQPSGIRFSTIRIDEAAGVGDIAVDEAPADPRVFNLQGICVANSADELPNLPKGIYIVGGKKIKN